jgi:hypothetical protein
MEEKKQQSSGPKYTLEVQDVYATLDLKLSSGEGKKVKHGKDSK